MPLSCVPQPPPPPTNPLPMQTRREVAERRAAKHKEYNMEEDHDRRDERKIAHLLPPRHDRCVCVCSGCFVNVMWHLWCV